ncbi:MAG: glycoside hydrolase [Chitinophagaceae bacterium]|nr:glycoside hydrolase [Chitinophagaceae bacterium]
MKKTTATLLFALFFLMGTAQQYAPELYNSMRWRNIGPFRGGRTVGAIGIPDQPNVFFIGVNNGGVWKTTDYGRTWKPLFDDQPTGSIGDIAIAESNPDIIYAGSGEGLQRPDLSVGDGIYKSTDGGKTWKNMGLRDAQQIGGMAVDSKNPDRIFVAALGHPYGPNTERGVYRSLNGGQSWERVLYKDENTGAIQVSIDPSDPNTIYASLWAGRQGPWENGAWNGKESGLFKSTDGGTTWTKLTKGLPGTDQGLGRIGFCIAPSNNKRLYATVDAPAGKGGIYRSDDGGSSWTLLTTDNRFYGRASDFAELKADPLNADIVYSANVVTWKSVDGGKNWTAFRGAPGGDDYHRIWINPKNPKIILIASDQGAIITVNGGETFSSWYNQSTAQFYHVSVDNAFPYNVYGGQQESGSVGMPSRGNDGQITIREWHPVGVEEYGYVAADPLDPNIIYGGKITRFDKRTGQVQNIAPEAVRSGKFRFLRTAPVLFSPVDPKTLFFAGNVIFKTRDGGNSWQQISPDLTRTTWDIPESVGVYTSDELKKMPQRGVVYTIAPSFIDINTIWAGTDDGLIQVTRDGGKTWKNVTPPDITSWSKVSLMEASHTDPNTAYAAVNRIRCDDMRPHIYKTNDGGKTWKEIVSGLPNEPINAVREDPVRKGMLYAGSENAVYVSFDEGANWQSLRLNMPATSIRDLVISKDDIVVGTHGRGFWILDDITPLRQLNASLAAGPVVLYKPQQSWRVRWNLYTDTPMPQEEPAGENPPDGAIINYYLKEAAQQEVVLEILDATGKLVRRFSSLDKPYPIPAVNIPLYWIRPQQILGASKGSHRFVWDMHYTPFNEPPSYPIAAVYQNTAPDPTSPWVMPGNYTVKLTVDGQSFTQPLRINMDPRVKTSAVALKQQYDLSMICYEGKQQAKATLESIAAIRNKLKGNTSQAATDKALAALETTPRGSQDISFSRLENSFGTLLNILQDTDMPPTTQAVKAVQEAAAQLKTLLREYETLKKKAE